MANLNVKVNLNRVGELIKENEEFIFSYTSENKDDFISLIMPIRQKPYIHNKLHPIFEMHLPEGYLLSIIKKHFSKLLKTSSFATLICHDMVKIANEVLIENSLFIEVEDDEDEN